jgi:hypothetical protein
MSFYTDIVNGEELICSAFKETTRPGKGRKVSERTVD